jgi:hypothetical protein
MAGTINTQAQLQVSSSATYTTNAANLITAALVRTLNENWISSSVVIPMTASMTVLSSSYAATASVLLGSVVSASYALTASSVTALNQTITITGSVNASGSITIYDANNSVITHHLKAPAVNGVEIQNNSAGVVGLFGAGGSLGSTFYGQVNSTAFSGSGALVYGVVSSSYAYTASSATSAGTASFATSFKISGSFIVTGSAQSNVVSQSVASTTASIDCRGGNSWFIQLPGSATTFFNFTNLLEGQTGNIIVSGSSAGTASFSSNVKQVSGSAYNNSTVGGIDVLSFSTWNNNVYLVNSKKFI